MNQHADVIRRHIEETSGFNNLKPAFISVAESTVMGSVHLPGGTVERVLYRNMEEFIGLRMKKWTI